LQKEAGILHVPAARVCGMILVDPERKLFVVLSVEENHAAADTVRDNKITCNAVAKQTGVGGVNQVIFQPILV
jgi:hypothetical protein